MNVKSINDHKQFLNSALSPLVLAVEDDPVSMNFLTAQMDALGYQVISAKNGQEALDILKEKKGKIDAVLLDREMPVMDGLTAIKFIKDNPDMRHIPVVMVTGADEMADIKSGLDAGVFYYLTKPVEPQVLQSVVSSAVRESERNKNLRIEISKHKASFNFIESAAFKFQTIEQAESLSVFIACCFPDPNKVVTGLAELMVNAVEHGNLGLGYEQKTLLLQNKTWRSEVEKLQQKKQHQDKFVAVTFLRNEKGIYVSIKDQGAGFNWRQYLTIDPARAADNHGRGIARARAASFTNIKYNEAGNQVVVHTDNNKTMEW